jgi:hypothetical protein
MKSSLWFARVLGAVLLFVLALAGCSAPPPPAADGDLDRAVVGDPVSSGALSTEGLMAPLPSCCPGSSCCESGCWYEDTFDATVAVRPNLSTSANALTIRGHRVGDPSAPACSGVRVDAVDAPLAVFYAVSRDKPMSFPTNVCTNIETRCTGWLWWRSCHDECVEWKSRWDEVKDGISDYVGSVSLAGGTEGAFAVSPQWDVNYRTNCTRTCFLWWCTTDCETSSTPALSCDPARYDNQTSGFGVLPSWSAPFIASLRAYSLPSPVQGNPASLSLTNAIARAREFLDSHPEYTVVVNHIVDDYPNGCGDQPWSDLWPAHEGYLNDPRVTTNIITIGRLDNYWWFPYFSGGVLSLVDWSNDVRGGLARALDASRRSSEKREFLIPAPTTGEPIDLDTFRFFLSVDGASYELPRWNNRWCEDSNGDPMQGYVVDYPEGPGGRLRVTLCDATQRWARVTRPTGYATYDCVSEHDAEATYVRTGDFDMTKCSSAMMKARPLLFKWKTALPSNAYVRFRLQFMARREDLDAGQINDVFVFPNNAVGWADLTRGFGMGWNTQWARVTATLYASTDPYHKYTPSIEGWDLKFTCVQ